MTDLVAKKVSTTVHQARLRLFQPTRRPVDKKIRIETPWGMAVVEGRLGQAHADLIEAVLYEPISKYIRDGRLYVLCDPYLVKKRANQKSGTFFETPDPKHKVRENVKREPNTLHNLVMDLRKAVVSTFFKVAGKDISISRMGGIIDDVVLVEDCALPMKHALPGVEKRSSIVFVFNSQYTQLLGEDLSLYYSPEQVSSSSGAVQAIARLLLGHKDEPNGGWKLDTLLDQVGVAPAGTSERLNRRREVRSRASDFEKIGYVLDGDRLRKIDAQLAKPCSKSAKKLPTM